MLRRFRRSPFGILWQTFFDQFFASESVSSDLQLRQTMIWVLAFLLAPVFLILRIFPGYQAAVARARVLNQPELPGQVLSLIVSVLLTYSMVAVGFIAAFVWDALAFDRRDAMVLGPLPVRGRTVIGAKLAALAAFLLGIALTLNAVLGLPFALATSGTPDGSAFVARLTGYLTASMGAATVIVAAIVTLRGAVALVGNPRLAAALGTALQFVVVCTILFFVLVMFGSRGMRVAFLSWGGGWMPGSWFLAAFKRMQGTRDPETMAWSGRALWSTVTLVAGAIGVSIAGFRRQMRRALAPPATARELGSARGLRVLARWIAGRDQIARSTLDFILLTLARSRAQQTLVAINAALGVAIVVASVTHETVRPGVAAAAFVLDLGSPARPRTAIVWAPLVLAYWSTIGLRASFFVPSELSAAWSFRANGPGRSAGYGTGMRAALAALLVLPTAAATLLMGPLVGWTLAGWHALLSCAVVATLVEIVALTVHFIPFTRTYQAGHAKLRTRWPLYLLGLLPFAYWPARFSLGSAGHPYRVVLASAVLAVLIAILELAARRRERDVLSCDAPDASRVWGSSIWEGFV